MRKFSMICFMVLAALASCTGSDEDMTTPTGDDNAAALMAAIADGLHSEWTAGEGVRLFASGQASEAEAMTSGTKTGLKSATGGNILSGGTLYGVFPATAAITADASGLTVSIPAEQTDGGSGYDPAAAVQAARSNDGMLTFRAVTGGIKLNFTMKGVTRVEIESVDGYALAGKARIEWDAEGNQLIKSKADTASIITFNAADEGGFTPGRDYFVSTLPCDVYGGYRLSIYKDGLEAQYYGVHQTISRAGYIAPADLDESQLEFDDPDAPLVEDERPDLDATTQALLSRYRKDPSDENKQALLEQMGVRYDKVVARKKAKLRELERDAKTHDVVEQMENIVSEMTTNRDVRLEQQFLRLIDPRTDDDPSDEWMVLRGSSAKNAYIAYTPVTNAEYARVMTSHTFQPGQEDYPVVNISMAEAQAYCDRLSAEDNKHLYRLPTDEEWTLAAGHMPKDVLMNSGGVEQGLTPVTAYAGTTGACGGIDFWGNCWEWTSTTDVAGLFVIKGGSWDSTRDDCRTEVSDVVRNGAHGYANVGFRVVRTDR